EMGGDGRRVEGFDAQAEMIHVVALPLRRRAALPPGRARGVDQVDQGAAGAQLGEAERRLHLLDIAAQRVATEAGQAGNIVNAQHDVVEPEDGEDHGRAGSPAAARGGTSSPQYRCSQLSWLRSA